MILSITHWQSFSRRNKLATFLHSLIDHRNDVTKCSKYCNDTTCWKLMVPKDHHSIVQNDVQTVEHYTGEKLFTDF